MINCNINLHWGDCREVLKTLSDQSVNCCVTSPPYFGLRSYGIGTENGEIGLEQTPDAYVAELVAVFREVRRVLRNDGTVWLNLGDSYCGSTSETPSKRENSPIAKGTVVSQENRAGRGDRTRSLLKNNIKPKDLIGIPWMVAFALRADGWYLRQDIIWHKPNPMPESVKDRCTKAHEYIFLLSKSAKYYFDNEAIKEPVSKGAAGSLFHTGKTGEHQMGRSSNKPRTSGNVERKQRPSAEVLKIGNVAGSVPYTDVDGLRNKRSVWTVSTKPYKGAHFATFPPDLITPCILAGCPVGGTVLDPFGGSGTTAQVAQEHGRKAIMIELNPSYIKLQEKRTQQIILL